MAILLCDVALSRALRALSSSPVVERPAAIRLDFSWDVVRPSSRADTIVAISSREAPSRLVPPCEAVVDGMGGLLVTMLPLAVMSAAGIGRVALTVAMASWSDSRRLAIVRTSASVARAWRRHSISTARALASARAA